MESIPLYFEKAKPYNQNSSADTYNMIDSIDHIVLTVTDLAQTIAFYQDALDMQIEYFGQNNERVALKFGIQKINLHQWHKEFEPQAARPTPGAIDLCFLSTVPLNTIIKTLEQKGIAIVEGPIERTGAQGRILSIYIRDPDANLLEISNLIPPKNK